jgi:hypothetical protein
MGAYHSSFTYLNKSSLDEEWLIVAFDPDHGEMDGYLAQEQIYTDSYNGSRRILYGTRWTDVITIKISVIKKDGSDFSLDECRRAYRWLTGSPKANWLDLYVGNDLKYSILCTTQSVAPYKMDARTVGLNIYFESLSPWAYSPVQSFSCFFDQKLLVENGVLDNDSSSLNIDENGTVYNSAETMRIGSDGTLYIDNSVSLNTNNQTDDLYTPVYLNIVFRNNTSDYLSIKNTTSNEETIITGMSRNEAITISSGQFIISDIPGKIFGNNFNFVWPRLVPGINKFIISGSGVGSINFTYRYPIKIGNCAIDVGDLSYDFYCNN